MVHCTGGAQTKVLHFVNDNCKVIKDNMFAVPPLFKTIQEESHTDWKEMYKDLDKLHRKFFWRDVIRQIIVDDNMNVIDVIFL